MSKLSRIFPTAGMCATILAAFSLWSVAAPAADELDEPADAASAQKSDAASPMSSPWPVRVTDNGRTFLIYQPQVDKWENNRLEGRSAVSVRNDASGQQNFGVVTFSARAELDQSSRTVTVRDAVISKADFPAVAAGADDYLSVLRPQFAVQSWRVAQDRLQSDMEIDKLAQQSAKQPLKNDPPRILYSERPAVLVPIDGNPALRPVADTGLMRITNTRALILQDKATSRYYLYVSDHWMTSSRLEGPWSVAPNPSPQLEQARQLATQQGDVDLLDADADEGAVIPAAVSVFVSTTPTELLQTDGPAQYAPIERTQLLYVTNSPNKLFLDLRTQNHYALISGRWYRTTTLAQGQWSYVPAASLPRDFAMIPAEHPTESVRAAVPGTPQAREAVIANSVPQVATVARSSAQLEIAYDGNPVFQPIEGTALQSAVNAPVPVIRISDASFYALDNGVWFVASSPFGPWTVANYVPSVIYSIPRNSPLYNVTYVRVYDSTPEVVYVGYTPGYVGSYVSSDDVVVYGTGWPYRPWIGSVWYGAPVTWGFGFSFFYSWWDPYPWHSWHHVAWVPPPPCFRPWWGPWHAPVYGHGRRGYIAGAIDSVRPPGSRLHNAGRIYDRWDDRSVVWNGPRAISGLHRSPAQSHSRTGPDHGFGARSAPDHGFPARPDGRSRRLGEDGNRDRGGRDAQVRGSVGNVPGLWTPRAVQAPRALQTSPAVQTLPAVQTPWRHPPVANQDQRGSGQPRVEAPSFAGSERRPTANGQFPPRERGLVQRQADEGRPRAPVDGRAIINRSLANGQQDWPAHGSPQRQSPQRIPPVAGVPIERAPSQPQRALPQPRSYSLPTGRVERPAMTDLGRVERPAMTDPGRVERRAVTDPGRVERSAMANPGRIERPVVANPGRGMERPSVNPGRSMERNAGAPQARVAEGRSHPRGGEGKGTRIGER